MAKHDENKDLRLLSSICSIDYAAKVISASKSTIIGNRRWGRIDYLTHYCGWHFIYDNSVRVKSIIKSSKEQFSKKDAKRKLKDNSLTNKKKKK